MISSVFSPEAAFLRSVWSAAFGNKTIRGKYWFPKKIDLLELIGIIRIFTWVAPGGVDLAFGYIDEQGGDGFLAVQGIFGFVCVVAD